MDRSDIVSRAEYLLGVIAGRLRSAIANSDNRAVSVLSRRYRRVSEILLDV